MRNKKVDKTPHIINYIPFTSICCFVAACSIIFFWKLKMIKKGVSKGTYINNTFNDSIIILHFCFGFVISIPYFFHHYIFIALLGLIGIFSKKPLYMYCGMVDEGIEEY